MAYIIMGRDECGDEFRADQGSYGSMEEAENNVGEARQRYPEAQCLWAELLKDKAYYASQHQQRWDDDTYDMY